MMFSYIWNAHKKSLKAFIFETTAPIGLILFGF